MLERGTALGLMLRTKCVLYATVKLFMIAGGNLWSERLRSH